MVMQYTIMVVKPDGVARNLADPIERILQENNFTILQRKECVPDRALIEKHLGYDDAYEQTLGTKILAMHDMKKLSLFATGMQDMNALSIGTVLRESVVQYHLSGLNIAYLLQGENAVQEVKKLCGATFPADAASETIRGQFGDDGFEVCMRERRSPHNIAHAAGSEEEAVHQIALWFPEFANGMTPQ